MGTLKKTGAKAQKSKTPDISNRLSISWIRLILCVMVFIIYGSAMKHDFTLDDDIFYLKHGSVQKGFKGISEIFSYGSLEKFNGTTGEQPYRPLTLLSFAFEKELFNNDPASSHFLNLLLYILILQVILSVLLRIFSGMNLLIPAMIIFLFAAHPIHTEVVSSVKSRDELLAGLFVFMAWLKLLPQAKDRSLKTRSVLSSSLFFALAVLSKESAFAFALIIPLSHLLLYGMDLKKTMVFSSGIFAVTFLFLILRFSLIEGGMETNPFPVHENILKNATGFNEHTATRMEILFAYLRLLFLPWPLSWDYSFNQIPVMDWTSFIPWLSLLLHLSLLVLSVIKFRRTPVLSFAILFYFISMIPVSNFILLNFSTLGERFLFIPSFAFAIGLLYLLTAVFRTKPSAFNPVNTPGLTILILLIVVVYSGMSMARNNDWKSNLSLFESGVKASPNSSRAHYSLATEYAEQARKSRDPRSRDKLLSATVDHFRTSLLIKPDNVESLYNLGNTLCVLGDTTSALEKYRTAVRLHPAYISALNNLSGVYVSRNQLDSALIYLKQAYSFNANDVNLTANIASVSFFAGLYDQAIDYAGRALKLDPTNRKSYGVLVDSYTRLGQSEVAERYRKIMPLR